MTKTETRIREIFARRTTKLDAVDDEYRQQYGEQLEISTILDIRSKRQAESGEPNAIAELEEPTEPPKPGKGTKALSPLIACVSQAKSRYTQIIPTDRQTRENDDNSGKFLTE